jgi:cell division protein FtsI (penicillin-binding protein 3)
MVNKMASEKAIKMMTNALTKAVEKGTGKSIFTPNLKWQEKQEPQDLNTGFLVQ